MRLAVISARKKIQTAPRNGKTQTRPQRSHRPREPFPNTGRSHCHFTPRTPQQRPNSQILPGFQDLSQGRPKKLNK